MKTKKWMFIISAILLILLLVFFGFLLYDSLHHPDSAQKTSTISYIKEESAPASVTVENQTGQFVVVPNDENNSQNTGKWVIQGLEQAPQYKNKVETIAGNMQSLYVKKVFEPDNNLSVYGLQEPSAKVTADFGDKTNILYIGNQNPEKTGYYCKEEGNSQIALAEINEVNVYLSGVIGLIDTTISPYVSTTDKSGNSMPGVQQCVIKRSDLEESIQIDRQEDGNLQITSPIGKKLSDENSTLIKNAISPLVASSVQQVLPTEENLRAFGLLSPTAVITYKINGEELKLLVGSVSKMTQTSANVLGKDQEQEDEDNTSKEAEYYVMVEGRPVVYSAAQTSLPWLTMNFE